MHLYYQQKQKPTRARKILAIIFICLEAVTLLYVMDYLIPYEIYNYLFSFIIIFLSILNIGLLNFGTEIFASEKYEKSVISKLVTGGFFIAQMVIGVSAAILSWIGETDARALMMVAYLLLSVGLCLYLIINAYKLASRIAESNQELIIYKKSIQYMGNVAVMILLVYLFLAIESLQTTFTLWGRLIWVFIILAMVFIYLGFIKPARSSKSVKP